ncbi:MAG: hypothetical protein AAFU84_10275 [Cyanobacteria bacterium J06633_23]
MGNPYPWPSLNAQPVRCHQMATKWQLDGTPLTTEKKPMANMKDVHQDSP